MAQADRLIALDLRQRQRAPPAHDPAQRSRAGAGPARPLRRAIELAQTSLRERRARRSPELAEPARDAWCRCMRWPTCTGARATRRPPARRRAGPSPAGSVMRSAGPLSELDRKQSAHRGRTALPRVSGFSAGTAQRIVQPGACGAPLALHRGVSSGRRVRRSARCEAGEVAPLDQLGESSGEAAPRRSSTSCRASRSTPPPPRGSSGSGTPASPGAGVALGGALVAHMVDQHLAHHLARRRRGSGRGRAPSCGLADQFERRAVHQPRSARSAGACGRPRAGGAPGAASRGRRPPAAHRARRALAAGGALQQFGDGRRGSHRSGSRPLSRPRVAVTKSWRRVIPFCAPAAPSPAGGHHEQPQPAPARRRAHPVRRPAAAAGLWRHDPAADGGDERQHRARPADGQRHGAPAHGRSAGARRATSSTWRRCAPRVVRPWTTRPTPTTGSTAGFSAQGIAHARANEAGIARRAGQGAGVARRRGAARPCAADAARPLLRQPAGGRPRPDGPEHLPAPNGAALAAAPRAGQHAAQLPGARPTASTRAATTTCSAATAGGTAAGGGAERLPLPPSPNQERSMVHALARVVAGNRPVHADHGRRHPRCRRRPGEYKSHKKQGMGSQYNKDVFTAGTISVEEKDGKAMFSMNAGSVDACLRGSIRPRSRRPTTRRSSSRRSRWPAARSSAT